MKQSSPVTLSHSVNSVRAVIRDAGKGAVWAALGCEVAIANMDDAAALTEAFKGATGVFILPPSDFDPEPGFPEARKVIAAVAQAIEAAAPQKVDDQALRSTCERCRSG